MTPDVLTVYTGAIVTGDLDTVAGIDVESSAGFLSRIVAIDLIYSESSLVERVMLTNPFIR